MQLPAHSRAVHEGAQIDEYQDIGRHHARPDAENAFLGVAGVVHDLVDRRAPVGELARENPPKMGIEERESGDGRYPKTQPRLADSSESPMAKNAIQKSVDVQAPIQSWSSR